MTKLEEMIQSYPIPKVCKIRQTFDRTRLDDPEEKLARLWAERDIPIRQECASPSPAAAGVLPGMCG